LKQKCGEKKVIAQLTLLAGVSVPSTSKRQMVLAIGRWVKGGNWEAAADILELQLSFFYGAFLMGGVRKEGGGEAKVFYEFYCLVGWVSWLGLLG